jgi:hypothetical protein
MPEPDVQVDLSSYPDINSDEFHFLSIDEQYELEDYHTLTEEATAVPPGQKVLCRDFCVVEKGEFEMCEGDVEVVRLQVPQQIRWKCLKCGHNGIITGFENSSSNLSGLSREEVIAYMSEKYGDPFDMESGPGFDDFTEDEFPIMSPEEEEDFVNWFNSLDENDRQAILADSGIDIDQMTDTFRETTGGLDPGKLYELLSADWEDPDGPVHLNGKLSAAELENSILFRNSRALLLKAQEGNGIGLTQAGNMRRKPISELIPECIWPEGYIEMVKQYNKVINEHDVWLLHSFRILLQLAGLVQKHKGRLKGVKKNAKFSLKSRSGELYRHLFITYFRKMNISYLTNQYDDYPYLQETVPYILYRTQQLADDWIPFDDLAEQVLLPSSYQEIISNNIYSTNFGDEIYMMVLKALELFGIIETRKSGDKPDWRYFPDQCRKTPLFDKFITFRI